MTIDRREVLRYLRMGGAEPDAALAERIEDVGGQVLRAARPAWHWRLERCAVMPADGNSRPVCAVGPLRCESCSLARELCDCPHAFLFCATLGADIDRLIRRLSLTSAADAMIAHAAATALIEDYCDRCQAELAAMDAVAGEELRMRFAPGYGDLDLALQRPLLAALDASRRAGIVLTEDLLMVPSKSVSAIIGAGKHRAAGAETGKSCAACSRRDCPYRRMMGTSP